MHGRALSSLKKAYESGGFTVAWRPGFNDIKHAGTEMRDRIEKIIGF